MTQDEKRIKIARACGWTCTLDDNQFWRATRPDGSFTYELWCSQDNVWSAGIPDYFHDLNACAEMEKVLTANQANLYRKMLDGITGQAYVGSRHPHLCYGHHATATQRAEAFGLTLGLWKEGE